MYKKILKVLATIIIGCSLLGSFAIYDLHSLGDKPKWNTFDQIRVKGYLLTGTVIGMIVPPIGPLAFFNLFASHGFYFATKTLPNDSGIEDFRDTLVTSSFCKKLKTFSKALQSGFINHGKRWGTKRIIHRVFFGQGAMTVFDDWAVLLAGTANKKTTQLAYFVWGMGIVPDERAPEFFGKQFGKLSFLFPLTWSNRLEEYGLAKGYWVLLTESDQTSGFSYQARKKKSAQRRRQFVIETQKLHATNSGKTLEDICGKHL